MGEPIYLPERPGASVGPPWLVEIAQYVFERDPLFIRLPELPQVTQGRLRMHMEADDPTLSQDMVLVATTMLVWAGARAGMRLPRYDPEDLKTLILAMQLELTMDAILQMAYARGVMKEAHDPDTREYGPVGMCLHQWVSWVKRIDWDREGDAGG